MSENHSTIEYTEALEKILKKEAERCLCLRWVHSKAQTYNLKWNTRMSIPVIILSMFAGSATLSGPNLLPFERADTIVGLISLLCAIMNTIMSHFAFAKKAESHRVATIHYAQLHRLLEMQLAMPRNQRIPADTLLENIRSEIERLNEIVPMIDGQVEEMFREKFHNELITKPPELNGLEPVEIVGEAPTAIKISIR